MRTTLTLIRHGEVHNPEKILYGRLPRFQLSKTGKEDALWAAEQLQKIPLAAIYSSPMLRTRQTAHSILQFHSHLSLSRSSHINEVKTSCEGMKESEIAKNGHDVYDNSSTQWEQPGDVLCRMLRFITRIRKKHSNSHVAAVTHGDPILFILFWANGIHVSAQNKLRLGRFNILREYPATGSLTTLEFTTGDDSEKPEISYKSR